MASSLRSRNDEEYRSRNSPRAPRRTAPVLQRRPDAAREAEAIDRCRRAQRFEAMQLDAAPLEAALLQNVARGRIAHPSAGDQVLDSEFLEGEIDHRPRRFGGKTPAPSARRRANSRVPVRPARANRCRRRRAAYDCFRSGIPSRERRSPSRGRTQWHGPVSKDAAGGGYFPQCGDRWRDARSPLRPRASACAASAVRSRGGSYSPGAMSESGYPAVCRAPVCENKTQLWNRARVLVCGTHAKKEEAGFPPPLWSP